MEEIKIPQAKDVLADEINATTLKFANELLEIMIKHKQNLERSHWETWQRIEQQKGHYIGLTKKICETIGLTTPFEHVDYMKEAILNHGVDIFRIKKMLEIYMIRHNEYSSKYKSHIEQNEPKYDEYMTMSYHDIEKEIERFNIETEKNNKEADHIIQKADTLCNDLKKEYNETLQEIKTLKNYKKEQRIQLESLEESISENGLLGLDKCEQRITQLKNEIAELKARIDENDIN